MTLTTLQNGTAGRTADDPSGSFASRSAAGTPANRHHEPTQSEAAKQYAGLDTLVARGVLWTGCGQIGGQLVLVRLLV